MLEKIQQEHRIHVVQFFSENIVKWMGHCFRHTDMPVFPFLSRSLDERLASLRLMGRRTEVSDSKWRSFYNLLELGLPTETPVGGILSVRGHAGFVCRWGEGWMDEFRRGPGWELKRHDKSAVSERVSLLMQMFRKPRVSTTFSAILDAPLAICDS